MIVDLGASSHAVFHSKGHKMTEEVAVIHFEWDKPHVTCPVAEAEETSMVTMILAQVTCEWCLNRMGEIVKEWMTEL